MQPSAVGGIDWFIVDLDTRLIKKAYSEFNSAAFLYNLGLLGGPPNATECLNNACTDQWDVVQGCGWRKD